ncbi:hypothetical protein A2U01_0004643, partial [Trifolium medium]|nr:hypothetical protein [Trifolium medium]
HPRRVIATVDTRKSLVTGRLQSATLRSFVAREVLTRLQALLPTVGPTGT